MSMTNERREKRPEKKPDRRSEERGTRTSRLDTPQEVRRSLVRRPSVPQDAFGSFAESFARFMGTAQFLIWMTVFVAFWILWNVLMPVRLHFDSYPFIFLTLMLSLQASYAAPLILLAQNRQELRDRVINEQDRQANARAHADMEFLAREVASLRMALGEVATRDFLRSELRNLVEELEERDADESPADATETTAPTLPTVPTVPGDDSPGAPG